MSEQRTEYEQRLRDEPSAFRRQDILIMASNNPDVAYVEYLELIEIESNL
ncbi:MAG: hypothetical protein ABUJ92_00620 [Desulfobacterales bacterium]